MTARALTLSLMLSCVAHGLMAQSDPCQLVRDWKLVKSFVNGMGLPPSPHAQQDGLSLHADMQFEWIEEGISQKGTWRLDRATNKIWLVFSKNNIEKVASIIRASQNELVLRLEGDWKMDMVIYLKANSICSTS